MEGRRSRAPRDTQIPDSSSKKDVRNKKKPTKPPKAKDTQILESSSANNKDARKKSIKPPKAKNAPPPLPKLSESDSDEDFYSNILNRNAKKTVDVKKKKPEKTKTVLSDDGGSQNSSLLDDDFSEKELSPLEKIKLNIAETKKKEKEELEKEMANIRNITTKSFSEAHGSNTYVNSNVEETKRNLRYMRKVERQMDTSPTERLKMHSSYYDKPRQKKIVENVTIMMNDLEDPGSARINYDWPMDETFEGLKEKMALKWDVDAACVRIEHAEKAEKICNGHTPRNFGLQPYEHVFFTAMILGERIPRVKDDTPITINFYVGGRRIVCRGPFEITKSTTFWEIKELAMKKLEISEIYKMEYNHEEIAEYETPGRLDMKDGDYLYINW